MNPRRAPGPGCRAGRRLAAVALLLLGGCLVIPVKNYPSAGSRGNISAATTDRLQVGVSTKEEIILLLGEPDSMSEDGCRMGYAWNRVKARWAVWTGVTAIGGEIARSYVMSLTFDADGRLLKTEVIKGWGYRVPPERSGKTSDSAPE